MTFELPQALITAEIARAPRTGPRTGKSARGARSSARVRGYALPDDVNAVRVTKTRLGRSTPWKHRVRAPKKPSKHYKADPRVVGKDGVQVCVSMPLEDFAKLCDLARHLRVSRSQLVRDLVAARHAGIAWKEADHG